MSGSGLPRLSGEVWAAWRARDAVERVVGWLERNGPAVLQVVLDFANRVGSGGLRTQWHAVGQLGATHTVEVGIAAQLRPAPGSPPELVDTWRHAVATAAWARVIAAWRGTDPHCVFLGGLLHSVGRQARLRSGGMTSERALGDAISRSWRLPAPVVACVRHHARFMRAPSNRDAVATVRVAAGFAAASPHQDLRALTWLGISEDDVAVIQRRVDLVEAYLAALTEPTLRPCT